jgi:hypothetical protein
MSVVESCASTELSMNSTIECTIDCGCTITSTRRISTSKSQRASIISSPLLKSVAESMVIFAPMFQVGCLSACSGVTSASFSAGQVRKGPPLAVRIKRRMSEEERSTLNAKRSTLNGSGVVPLLRVGS